ncbi:hypothetical protein [Mesorhizobium sp. 8]|uniref:hypothetical protein n=1 Tax=Mesorhizobium sp. 8 TaxID=2584466 RepID=UPI00112164E3|nr:hypothetical protein [Mesorhizobium sp. 8]QDB98979.1 hypothetical protein FGU64_00345 [Mesorhizobium sp. 8]
MKSPSSFPAPVPGLVIRYSYLWRSEHLAGREEGRKDRPCAVVLSLVGADDKRQVVVLPITHSPPSDDGLAFEIPHRTKRRLGLDDGQSWVIVSEANLFSWPGPDLRPAVNGDLTTIVHGLLPDSLFHKIRDRFVATLRERRARLVQRTS